VQARGIGTTVGSERFKRRQSSIYQSRCKLRHFGDKQNPVGSMVRRHSLFRRLPLIWGVREDIRGHFGRNRRRTASDARCRGDKRAARRSRRPQIHLFLFRGQIHVLKVLQSLPIFLADFIDDLHRSGILQLICEPTLDLGEHGALPAFQLHILSLQQASLFLGKAEIGLFLAIDVVSLLELRCRKGQSLESGMGEGEDVERVDEQILVEIVRLVIREPAVLSQAVEGEKLNRARPLVTEKQKRVARDRYPGFTSDGIVEIGYPRTKAGGFPNQSVSFDGGNILKGVVNESLWHGLL